MHRFLVATLSFVTFLGVNCEKIDNSTDTRKYSRPTCIFQCGKLSYASANTSNRQCESLE